MQGIDGLGADARRARILISGDQALIRAALRLLVESAPGMTVVGECEGHAEALSAALAMTAADLILLDFDFCTGDEGVRAEIGALLDAANGTPVLILTASDDCHAAHYAIEHGAVGFVLKSRPPEVLHRAIQAGIAGEAWLERSAIVAVFRSALDGKRGHADPGDAALTRRECEIVELVVLGLQNKSIAQRLFIAETTVRHHLTSIFGKLHVTNRFELMRRVFSASSVPQRVAARY